MKERVSLVRSQAGMWGCSGRRGIYTSHAAPGIKAPYEKAPFACVGESSLFDTLMFFMRDGTLSYLVSQQVIQ